MAAARLHDVSPGPKEILGRLALVGVSVLLTLLLAEGTLRLAGYNYTPLAIRKRERLLDRLGSIRADARLHHAFEDKHFTYDPRLIWRPLEGRSVFNSQGYRGPELAQEKKPGEVRVLAIGNSNTLGWAKRDGGNWPGFLGGLLAETDPRIVVVNAGVWGYTIYQGFLRLEDALPFEPDIVLVSFGSNEAHPVALPDREFQRLHPGGFAPALSRLKVAQLVFAFHDRRTATAHEPLSGPAGLQNRVPPAEFRDYLVRIAELGERRSFACLFLTRPYLGSSADPSSWKHFAPRYRELTAEVAREQSLPLVDLYEHFREQPAYFADESHFTSLGHRVAAKLVYDAMAPLLVERARVEPARLLPPGPGFPDRVEIDLRSPASRQNLAFGFSVRKRKEGGIRVRSRGHGSTIWFLLAPGSTGYRMTLEAGVARGPERLRVEVTLNGEPVGDLAIGRDDACCELLVAGELLEAGLNYVAFYYEGARPHSDVTARKSNPIVQFESFRLGPVG